MNIRKVKLELTTELINQKGNPNVLQTIKEFMKALRAEVGHLIRFALVKKESLNNRISKKTYALQYENCIVDVELILNGRTNRQDLYRFNLR